MAIFNKYPYTNFHEMNLDWILQELKDLTDEWADFENTYKGITANATSVPYGDGASVSVSGGDGEPFNFEFEIPAGKDLKVLSTLVSYGISDSSTTQPDTWVPNVPVVPQAYYLWTRVILNFNDGSASTFYSVSRNGLDGSGSVVSVNNISPDAQGNINVPIPQASNDTPQSDTQYGYEGISNLYSRADHRHVSDSAKVDKLSNDSVGDESAYIIQDTATQTKRGISSTPVANNIVKYNANGNIVVNEPQSVNEVMRLIDVRDNFVSIADANDFVKDTDYATSGDYGIVKPDNSTITINNGVISSTTSGLKTMLLWTNSNPGASFSPQTINLGMTNLKGVAIEFRIYSSELREWNCTIIGSNGYLMASRYSTPPYILGLRPFQVNLTDGTVEFRTAYPMTTYGSYGTEDNNYCVPISITGIY